MGEGIWPTKPMMIQKSFIVKGALLNTLKLALNQNLAFFWGGNIGV
jgi:hypothetical protein